MRSCIKCGKQLEDYIKVCPSCGTIQNNAESYKRNNNTSYKTNGTNTMTVILSIVVVCLIIISIFLAVSKRDNTYKPASIQTTKPTYQSVVATPIATSHAITQVPSTPQITRQSFKIPNDKINNRIMYRPQFMDTDYGYYRIKAPWQGDEPDFVPNCYQMLFTYTATSTNNNWDVSGTRDVYVRDYDSEMEESGDKYIGWNYVGSFEYNCSGQPVSVQIDLQNPQDVCCFVIVRAATSNTVSFNDEIRDICFNYYSDGKIMADMDD